MRFVPCSIVAAVCLMALFTPAEAAIMPRFSAEDLLARSERIMEGTITRSWTAWDSKHSYIWTHYEVAVKDTIRGEQTATVTLSEPGGSLDGVTQMLSGMTTHTVGETSILFLYKTPIGYWRLSGGPQGKFVESTDKRVHAGRGNFTYVERSQRDATAIRATALGSFDNLSVAEFKTRIRNLAASHPHQVQR